MSKKSYNEIELIIKKAVDAHEPAFDEGAWQKMEALLNKEKDRKRPFIFWLWLLLPLLIGSAVISYFTFNNDVKEQEIAIQKDKATIPENMISNSVDVNNNSSEPVVYVSTNNNNEDTQNKNDENVQVPVSAKKNRPAQVTIYKAQQNKNEDQYSKKNLSDKVKAKMKASITSTMPETDDLISENINEADKPDVVNNNLIGSKKQEEIIIIKTDADKIDEKGVEKIIDSLVERSVNDKRSNNKLYRFYIIAASGAEVNGVKLFSADKITGRVGFAVGYQITDKLSVQAGFFTSNKKYVAAGSNYKTKPGTYWNAVDIKNIEANCRVYEIPVTVRYDFTPGKKLNIFASAGLSSYIMKKEDYRFYYDSYGYPHQAEVHYRGNKNLFSVLRLSAGIEKKISNRFSIFASPGISVPLSGVGEGEVKLYSTDIIVGLKYTPFRKK